jgi:hypothetical protein
VIDDPSKSPRDKYRRTARNSKFLIVLIVAAATVVGLQYTTRAFFSADKTSTLWGDSPDWCWAGSYSDG